MFPRFAPFDRLRHALLRPNRGTAAVALAAAGAVGAAGCEVKSFIDPAELVEANAAYRYDASKKPRVVEFPNGQGKALVVPILRDLDFGIERGGGYFSQSRPVQPDDLIADNRDYPIGAGDAVQVRIPELISPQSVTEEIKRVTNSGTISLPLLNQPVQIVGLTEAEAEQAVSDAYRDADILRDPQVSLVVVESRNRIFTIYGFIAAPGDYPILETDFNLLTALVRAGGVLPTSGVETAYVIRKKDNGTPSAGDEPMPELPPRQGLDGVDPLDPLAPRSDAGPLGDPLGDQFGGDTWEVLLAASQDGGIDETVDEPMAESVDSTADNMFQPLDDVEDRVIEIDGRPMRMGDQMDGGAPLPTTTPAEEEFEGGVMPAVLEPLEELPAEQPAFEFPQPEEPDDIEVIRVPIKQLLEGQFKFNVAIKPGDKIFIEPPFATGFYYVGGHANRNGVYEFRGQRVTVSQAINAAGMLDPVAIPSRSELVRRVTTPEGEEVNVHVRIDIAKIFAGQEPNIYLHPHDEIRIGTNFVAPFIAAARNAFRITYGFGFLYDRNFARDDDRF
jgi:protein involved in polysaccharide export with SLBB domain